MAEMTLDVHGMSCNGCEAKVETALSAIDGVASVSADHETDAVLVTIEDSIDVGVLAAAVNEAGYRVEG